MTKRDEINESSENNDVLNSSESESSNLEEGTLDQDVTEQGVSPFAKLAVVILAFSIVGAGFGLGITKIINHSKTATAVEAEAPAPYIPEQGPALTDDDPLKDWNLQSAARISPLISQLARAPRAALGSQIELCKTQQSFLGAVLELPAPPQADVAKAFDRWKDSVKSALDACVNVNPTGNDPADIKTIVKSVDSTLPRFEAFLKALKPFVNVSYEAHPEAFEDATQVADPKAKLAARTKP